MLKIVQSACVFSPDRGRGVVVVESDCSGPPFLEAFNELEGQAAVQMAQAFAASLGCAPAYLNGNKIGPYPVNSEGKSMEHVRGENGEVLPPQHPLMQPANYRVDIPVSRPIR